MKRICRQLVVTLTLTVAAFVILSVDVQGADKLASSITSSISITSQTKSNTTNTSNNSDLTSKPSGSIKSKLVGTNVNGLTSSQTNSMAPSYAVKVPSVTLSARAESLARTLKFDRKVLIMVKRGNS